MSVETRHFRLMPTGHLRPHRAERWIGALRLLGWDTSPSTDDAIERLVEQVEPHMLAIDAALDEYERRTPEPPSG